MCKGGGLVKAMDGYFTGEDSIRERVDLGKSGWYATGMTKEEKEFVGQARSRIDREKMVGKWETTLRRDGRWAKGWRVTTVHRGGTHWWVYIVRR
jgi:hypothetical protein